MTAPLRFLAATGALAPIVFTASWTAASAVQSDYSIRHEDLSGLAARSADHAWLMIGGLVVTGLLTAVFSLALGAVLTGRAAALGAYLVGIAGFGAIALGLLRNDCSSVTAACRKRVEAGEVSWEHTAHDVLSVPVLVCLTLAPAALAFAFADDKRLRPLAGLSAVAAGGVGVLLVLAGLETPASWQGAVQKAAVTLALVWLELIALWIWLLTRRRS